MRPWRVVAMLAALTVALVLVADGSVVGPDPPGQREPHRVAVVESLSAGTAIAFDLGR